jgi:lipopolysaccharide/colanic/teichoic acid biosynthesis glycosyltransferase/glycosyltransferase involved in cell wall biosynthesis
MKVAHLTTVDSSLRFLLFPQLKAVLDAGEEAIGISAPGPWVEGLEADGIRHLALHSSTRSMSLRRDFQAALELWRVLRAERLDILHTHNPKPGLYGRVLGRLTGVPLVINTVHGLFATEHDPWAKRGLVYLLEGIAARFSDMELVQSAEDLALMHRLGISRKGRTLFLGNGVDVDRFRRDRFQKTFRSAKRVELGIGQDKVVLGIVARLVAEKGFLELFEALPKFDPNVEVMAIGPHDPDKADALGPEVVKEATRLGVSFLGERSDVDELYLAMDLFVLPSHREGFPRAAMEAAASGLAVIATDIRGCREVVDDQLTGLLVGLGDIDALANAVNRLARDPFLRQRMGVAARAKAEAEFDERRVVQTVLDAYALAAERKGRTDLKLAGGSTASLSSPALTVSPAPPARSRAKRVVDVLGSLLAIGLTALPMALIAIAIRVMLGRPVLFEMSRPGLGGQPFLMKKFRTMVDAYDADGQPLPDADRLTAMGRFLRRTSLDELPELFHVLEGKMSLVGPRPLRTEYLTRYNHHQARRHQVKPGVTGWAQINGRNAISWGERLDLDVWYVDNWSLALDFRIIGRTFAAVANRSGISAQGHATMPEFTGEGDTN